MGKRVLARASNLAPPCLCTSSCGLITCASGARVAVSVVTAPRLRPVDTIYRPAISSRYIAHDGANMTRHFGWNAFAFGFGPRGLWGGPRGGGRRRQWFESGDRKYVTLKLLKDKPRHGSEVWKELEDQMHGRYSPSPGTAYPTLQWLEDEGLVVAKDVEGKKVYEITDVGRRFLDEHRDVVDDIFDRVRDAVDRTLGGGMSDVNRYLGRLLKTAYRTGWRARDEATRQRLVAILDHVVGEVEALATAKSSPAA